MYTYYASRRTHFMFSRFNRSIINNKQARTYTHIRTWVERGAAVAAAAAAAADGGGLRASSRGGDSRALLDAHSSDDMVAEKAPLSSCFCLFVPPARACVLLSCLSSAGSPLRVG